uniref:Uncharacterized protein n=1 Tax=Ditylenchus dipsaci TaxID=166011 RepID=A0A915DE22_9BILA
MSAQVYAEYFDSEWLFVVWHECLPLAFTVSNVTFAVGSFLLVAATIERYLQTIKNPGSTFLVMNLKSTALWQLMGKHRQFGVLLAVSCGLLLRGSIFFEIETYHLQHCTGLASMGVLLSSLAKDPYYDSIWRFWIRRITTIFVPFLCSPTAIPP